MQLTIYGCGYLGLVTGVCLAKLGHEVLGYDIDKEKINRLSSGDSVIYEKNFDELFQEVWRCQKIRFSSQIDQAAKFSNIHLICVGTPALEDGSANLSYVYEAIRTLVEYIDQPSLFIIRSTVPVGTTETIRKELEESFLRGECPFSVDVAFLPEFFSEGTAIINFMEADRIIVGVDQESSFQKIQALYAPLIKVRHIPLIRMSFNSAELTKYASNAFLATKISFINVISQIAENTHADIQEVIEGMSYDKRLGCVMARAGCGFGGSCLGKDLKALILTAKHNEHSVGFLRSILSVNEKQKTLLFEKLNKFFAGHLRDKVIAIWGLSFKPNTNDIRDAASCILIDLLLVAGARIQAYDPVAEEEIQKKYQHAPNLILSENKGEVLNQADALLILTEWEEFQSVDPKYFKDRMKNPIIFDGRNIYDPKRMLENGIQYYGIGRGLSL